TRKSGCVQECPLSCDRTRHRRKPAVSGKARGDLAMITKVALPRRTFLRGAGTILALPVLDAMTPAAVRAAAPTMRLGFFYVPNGMQMVSVIPKGEGTAFEM